MSRLGKELKKLVRAPPDGIKFIPNEDERMDEIHAEIAGPGARRNRFRAHPFPTAVQAA